MMKYLQCRAKRWSWGESYQLLRCVPDDQYDDIRDDDIHDGDIHDGDIHEYDDDKKGYLSISICPAQR